MVRETRGLRAASGREKFKEKEWCMALKEEGQSKDKAQTKDKKEKQDTPDPYQISPPPSSTKETTPHCSDRNDSPWTKKNAHKMPRNWKIRTKLNNCWKSFHQNTMKQRKTITQHSKLIKQPHTSNWEIKKHLESGIEKSNIRNGQEQKRKKCSESWLNSTKKIKKNTQVFLLPNWRISYEIPKKRKI